MKLPADAKEWNDHKRDASYLYSGGRLINAREQLATKKLVLSELAGQFVQAGRARQRRSQMALIGGVSAIIALLIVAVIVFSRQSSANAQLAQQAQAASTLAVGNAATAQTNAMIAHAGELAAQSISIRGGNFPLSLLLGIEAYQTLILFKRVGPY